MIFELFQETNGYETFGNRQGNLLVPAAINNSDRKMNICNNLMKFLLPRIFRETNVYGVKVPWAEGACGSAAIVLNNGADQLSEKLLG